MFLFEILKRDRTLAATSRFRETFKIFQTGYPELGKALFEFVKFRLANDIPFGPKDRPFNNKLRGYWHYHLIHGRAIVVYQINQHELKLFCVTDHSYTQPRGVDRLAGYLQQPNVTFSEYNIDSKRTLSPAQVKDIRDLFFLLAADREARAHVKSFADLLDYVRAVIDEPTWSEREKDAAALAAFGGKDAMLKMLNTALRQTAIHA
jgi:hypothetical protein